MKKKVDFSMSDIEGMLIPYYTTQEWRCCVVFLTTLFLDFFNSH